MSLTYNFVNYKSAEAAEIADIDCCTTWPDDISAANNTTIWRNNNEVGPRKCYRTHQLTARHRQKH